MPNLPPKLAASANLKRRLARIRQFSHLLDNAIGIPGTRFRVGLDPLLGLIPGGGDTAGMALSSWILLEAARMGASKSVLGQMAFNILLETIAGIVPGLGDIFDVAWKANARNVRLLEDHLQLVPDTRPRNRGFAVLLMGLLFLVLIATVALSIAVLRWIWGAIGGQ